VYKLLGSLKTKLKQSKNPFEQLMVAAENGAPNEDKEEEASDFEDEGEESTVLKKELDAAEAITEREKAAKAAKENEAARLQATDAKAKKALYTDMVNSTKYNVQAMIQSRTVVGHELCIEADQEMIAIFKEAIEVMEGTKRSSSEGAEAQPPAKLQKKL
jgi:Zn-dependent metalloprotease